MVSKRAQRRAEKSARVRAGNDAVLALDHLRIRAETRVMQLEEEMSLQAKRMEEVVGERDALRREIAELKGSK